MKKYAFYLILAAIFGVGATFLYNNFIIINKSGQLSQVDKKSSQTNTPVVVEQPVFENTLSIADFSPGNVITVESAKLSAAGFVVVHEDNNNKPGAVIGVSSLLSAGEHSNLVINLNRPSVKNEILYVIIHSDDGDGVFNTTTDNVANDNLGHPAMIDFQVGLE